MSVIKHKEQRVGIFIDAQNLYHSAKNLHHGRVNFVNVLNDALADRQLVRAIAYVITTESGEESGFFDALNKIGIETKTKDLQIFSSGSKKADWDVGLAVDAIKLAPKLDVVILASGDGDFVPLVEYLKMNGCQVEVITFGKSASGKLKEAADDFVDLDANTDRYVLGQRFERRDHRPYANKNETQASQAVRKEMSKEEAASRQKQGQENKPDGKIGGMRRVIRKIR